MKTLFEFAGRLSAREPAVHGNLAVYPVFGDGSPRLDYLTLEEALAAGGFKVGEVGGGTVPELLVHNGTGRRVLLLDGEELIGAKQNRILNTSILVEAGSEIHIPVSCVEHGRWDRGEGIMHSGEVAYPELRRQKAQQVHDRLRATGLHHSDQSAVWQEIDQRMQSRAHYEPTGRMEGLYEIDREALAQAESRLPCCPGACGVVAVIGGRIACADVFDSPATLEKLWPRLISSYCLDAVAYTGESSRAGAAVPSQDTISRFLALPPDALVEVFATPGIGQNLRFRTPDRVGSALAFEEAVVHLEVFPANGGAHQFSRSSRIARPSQRGPRQ
jgi:hypothetical protein